MLHDPQTLVKYCVAEERIEALLPAHALWPHYGFCHVPETQVGGSPVCGVAAQCTKVRSPEYVHMGGLLYSVVSNWQPVPPSIRASDKVMHTRNLPVQLL